MEEKIVFVSSSCTVLVAAAEAVQQLLYPFKFPHVFIPILPTFEPVRAYMTLMPHNRKLLDFLAAPTAYIMGINTTEGADMPEDAYQVRKTDVCISFKLHSG